jgi:hypothetical protein
VSEIRNLATTDEVATFLRKPPRTLEQWRYRGVGPRYVKAGRDVRYRWQDVETWLEQLSVKAA